ncbi:hypothetical protein BZA70DRAFT_77672 [Myxozyma melibiosi]|uniref:Myb-like domain-containing protein n=1 Tax=Myxozyma melibiosi TaxID=54550 RepID=A0ABR1F0I4_9ASCO
MSHPQTSNLKRKSNFPSAPSPSPSNPSALRSDRAESLSIPPSLPPDGSQIDATLLLNPRTMSNISCLLQSDLPAYELPAIQETSKQTECTTLQPSTSLRLEVMSGNGTVNGAELARARELQELHDLLEDTELVQFVRIADWTVDDLSILIRAKMNDLSWPVIADIIGDDRTVGDCKEIYFRLTLFCRRRRAINQTLQSIASSAQITRLESPIEPPALPSQREDNVEESPSASALQIVQYQSAVTSRPARQQSLAKVSPQKSPAKKTVRKRRGTGSATSQVIATAASNLAAESLESNDRPNQTAEIKGETEQTPHHTAHSELNSEEHPPAARPSLAENSAKDTAAGAENSAAQTLLSAASITETAPDSLSRSPNQRAGQKVTEKVRVVCPPSTSGQQTDPAETGSQELSGQTTSSQPGPEDSPRQTTPSLPATEKPLGRTTPSQPVTEESSGHMFGSPFNDLESIAVEFPAGARVIRVSAIDETSSVSKNEVPEVPETLREVELNSGPSVIERPVGESPQNKEMSSASGRSQAAADSGTDVTKRFTLMSKFQTPIYATVRSGEISLSRFPEKLSLELPKKDLPEQKADDTSSVESKSIEKPEFKKPSIAKPPKLPLLSTMRPPRSLLAIRDVDDSRGESSLHGFSWNRNETITRRKKSTKNERSRQSVIRMIRGEEEPGSTRRERVDYDGDSFEDAETRTDVDDGEVEDERLDTDATISVPDSSVDEDSEIESGRANIVHVDFCDYRTNTEIYLLGSVLTRCNLQETDGQR